MFFHFSIHRVEVESISDHPFDPGDKRIEHYTTWHLSELERLDDTSPSTFARMGSSARGAPDDGLALRKGDDLVLADPQITLGLPDNATDLATVAQYRLDFHHWESDSSTEKVRAAFTDVTLKAMVAALRGAQEDEAAARADIGAWLKENWKDAARAIAIAVAPTTPWVSVGMNLLPLVEQVVKLLARDSDDYIQRDSFVLQWKGDGSSVQWQITGPDGASSGLLGPNAMHDSRITVMDAPGENRLHVTYRFRLIAP